MVVAYRQSRSMHASAEVQDAAPTTVTARAAALCVACLVPAAVGAVWLVIVFLALRLRPAEPWLNAGFGSADRLAILAGHSVAACLGASLLGVAAGRWLRFPGAVLVLLIGVGGWATLGIAVVLNGLLFNGARLFSPFAFFGTVNDKPRYMEGWPGSPAWYLLWLAALCGLAAVAALLRDAGGTTRTRLLRIGAAGLAVAALSYGLAVTGGAEHAVRVYPDGTVISTAGR